MNAIESPAVPAPDVAPQVAAGARTEHRPALTLLPRRVPGAPVIHQLDASDSGALLLHFLGLSVEDRALRFGGHVNDRIVEGYVKALDFDSDTVFGVLDADLNWVAVAHLAELPADGGKRSAELGISVSPQARQRGIGSRLLQRAALHCRNLGVDTLYLHCRASNGGMLRIARRAGMEIKFSYGEADAYLGLQPADHSSLLTEWLETQMAMFDGAVKRNARGAAQLMEWWRPLPTAA